MESPYAPPKANLEQQQARPPRPAGIIVIAALFIFFSVATTVLAFLGDQGGEWYIVLGCSVVLVALLRGVFYGRERDRKTGVFIGFFIAFLNLLGGYEPSEPVSDLKSIINIAEAIYALGAAAYLIWMKKSAFFQ
jgi:hypothetical protein